MKKTKLKKGDVVVFEWTIGEVLIGYVSWETFSGDFSICTMISGCEKNWSYHIVKPKYLTKIGTMPPDWM